ncbi:MAG: apolipoprotein N-acyltransferase [Pseudohongiellaceae bacterium]|jgi:apolipoprotein N-acyltransferase
MLTTITQGWPGHLVALLAGSLITLSLAPFNIWPLGIVSCTLFVLLFNNITSQQAILRGWFYGLGLFGSGASWVYVSIHEFGYAPVPLAIFITFLFTGGLALTWAIFGWIYHRYIQQLPAGSLLGFAAIFVLCEWFRNWFLTGFPWVYIGYGHLETPLAGWSPVGGVFTLGFIVALTGAALAQRLLKQCWHYPSLMMVLMLWLTGFALQHIDWVKPADKPVVKIAMVQANISQAVKWDKDQYWPTLNSYNRMSRSLWAENDIVIWPEAAIPGLYHNAKPFLDGMAKHASKHNTALITGIPSVETIGGQHYTHNSIVALGNGEGIYHKQRLVPFGEYVPLEYLLRGLIQFFDLPMSAFSAGSEHQPPLTAADITLVPLICYEVVYPDLARQSAANADMLLTISNDGWFGDSIGPLQHLEMAQMRALENGRYLLRSTGSGVSAIVDERGRIVTLGPQFKQAIIRGEAKVMVGATPFSQVGSWPILSLCFFILVALAILKKRQP